MGFALISRVHSLVDKNTGVLPTNYWQACCIEQDITDFITDMDISYTVTLVNVVIDTVLLCTHTGILYYASLHNAYVVCTTGAKLGCKP